ncbi:DUF2256 domain-containing protein [Rheinheimera texasensis]|uniref:DUF2256 domain-containing protein n=1 Tax=Rheinheimera texasensis TaxID=306205 RepID=UPI0032B2F76E
MLFSSGAIQLAHHKLHLPEKICPVCRRPFQWRKKWQRDWATVKYCSERCRRSSKGQT